MGLQQSTFSYSGHATPVGLPCCLLLPEQLQKRPTKYVSDFELQIWVLKSMK